MRRLLCATLLWWMAMPSRAIEVARTNEYALETGVATSGQLVVLAERATFDGEAGDEVFVLASEASFNGTFSNSLWAAGSTIRFGGRALDNVRFAGNAITISGQCQRAVSAAGASIQLTAEGVVGAEAALVAESVTLEGTVQGPVKILADRVTLAGIFADDVRVTAADIVVMPGTRLAGDLVYVSPQELLLDNRVELQGELVRETLAARAPEAQSSLLQTILEQFFFMVSALLAGLLFTVLFPDFTGRAVRTMKASLLRCALSGLLAICLVPMLAVAALVTIVGIPLGLLMMGFYAAMLYFGKILAALALGGAMLRARGPQSYSSVFAAMLLGLLVIYAASAVPGMGGGIWLTSTLLGVGAFASALLARERPAPPAPPPVPEEPTRDAGRIA